MKRRPPPVCPVCGEDVPPKAEACPDCGACYESGWKEDSSTYDGLDLPDEAWSEDGEEEARKPSQWRDARSGISPFWRVVALVTLVAAFWGLWRWLFADGRTPWW